MKVIVVTPREIIIITVHERMEPPTQMFIVAFVVLDHWNFFPCEFLAMLLLDTSLMPSGCFQLTFHIRVVQIRAFQLIKYGRLNDSNVCLLN